jgi:hypothetical protein
MSLLEKMADASRANRVLGIDDLEDAAWEKLGYRVYIPSLIGCSSEYLAPYQEFGFNHPSKNEQVKAWGNVKKSVRWVEVRSASKGVEGYKVTHSLQVHQVLDEILSLMKKDSVFAASLMNAFLGCSAFPMLKAEGIVFDEEIAKKMNKYFDATI